MIRFLTASFLIVPSLAQAEDWQKFIPQIAQQYINEGDQAEKEWDRWEDKEEVEDWQKYIPESVKKYIPSIGEKTHHKKEKAKGAVTYYGPTSLANQSLKVLEVMGPLTLTDSKITKELNVYGPFKGTHVRIARLTVQGPASLKEKSKVGPVKINGPLKIKRSLVEGPAHVNGPIMASDSIFQGKVSAASTKTSFENCTLKALEIRPSGNADTRQQVVYLKGKTTVEGDVVFLEKGGKLVKDDAVVIKGKVHL